MQSYLDRLSLRHVKFVVVPRYITDPACFIIILCTTLSCKTHFQAQILVTITTASTSTQFVLVLVKNRVVG